MRAVSILVFCIVVTVSISARATMKVEGFQCPIEFEGTVAKVEDVDKKDHPLAKVKITFNNELPIRGGKFQQKSVKILKHGLLQVEKDKLYSIALRGDKVCDIRSI